MFHLRDLSVGPTWAAIIEPDRTSTTSATTSAGGFDDEDDELVSAQPSQSQLSSMKRKRSSPGMHRPKPKRANASQDRAVQLSSDEEEFPRHISHLPRNPNIYPLPQGVTRSPPINKKRRINVQTHKTAASASASLLVKRKGKQPSGRPSQSRLRPANSAPRDSIQKAGPSNGQEIIEISDDDDIPARAGPSQQSRRASQYDAPPIDISSEDGTPPSKPPGVNIVQQSSPVMISAGINSSRPGKTITFAHQLPALSFGNSLRKVESASPSKKPLQRPGADEPADGERPGTQARPIELDLGSDEEPPSTPPEPPIQPQQDTSTDSPPAFCSPSPLPHFWSPRFPVDDLADMDDSRGVVVQEKARPTSPMVNHNKTPPTRDSLSSIRQPSLPSLEGAITLLSSSAPLAQSSSPAHPQEDECFSETSNDRQVHNADSAEPPSFSSFASSPARRLQTSSPVSAAAAAGPLSTSPTISKAPSPPPLSSSPSPPTPISLPETPAPQTSFINFSRSQGRRASGFTSKLFRVNIAGSSPVTVPPPPPITFDSEEDAVSSGKHRQSTPTVRDASFVPGYDSPNTSRSPSNRLVSDPLHPSSRHSQSSPANRRKLGVRLAGPEGLFKHVHMEMRKKTQESRESTIASEPSSTSLALSVNDGERRLIEREPTEPHDDVPLESIGPLGRNAQDTVAQVGPSHRTASVEPRDTTPFVTVTLTTSQPKADHKETLQDSAAMTFTTEGGDEDEPQAPTLSAETFSLASSNLNTFEETHQHSLNEVERPGGIMLATPSNTETSAELQSSTSPDTLSIPKSLKGESSAVIFKRLQLVRKQNSTPQTAVRIQSQQRLKELHHAHFDLTQETSELLPAVFTQGRALFLGGGVVS
ncbi:hypothetical protein OF83DRAFT_398334 [Amylostereum chailletii]|nr:hypothetical protein OF83DRAFT_398334 [Amylostereum chailletii]